MSRSQNIRKAKLQPQCTSSDFALEQVIKTSMYLRQIIDVFPASAKSMRIAFLYNFKLDRSNFA